MGARPKHGRYTQAAKAKKPCTHRTLFDFKDAAGLWICSVCGKHSEWTDDHQYWGNIECGRCWMASIDDVTCSPRCRGEPPIQRKAGEVNA